VGRASAADGAVQAPFGSDTRWPRAWGTEPRDCTAARWQLPPEAGVLALWEIGCYCLDALAWQFGPAAEANVLASAQPRHDLTAVALRFTSWMSATAWWSFSAAWSKRFLVIGSTGTLELERPFQADGAGCAWVERRRERRKVDLPGADSFLREIDHFTTAVSGEVPPAITLEDSAGWIGLAEKVNHTVAS
jgi:predicted dehydrogenase